MNVDLNNLRKQAAFTLDDIIKTLNDGILPEGETVYHGEKKRWKGGNMIVSTEDLQKDLQYLRQLIYSLLCCYEEDNPLFQTVFEDVENNGGLAHFNPNNE